MTKETDTNFWNKGSLFARLLIVVMASCIAVISAKAQGLPGTNFGLEEIQGRAPIPDLIPGKGDQARWQVLTDIMPRLIGMSKKQVKATFGKGAEQETGKLTYQITRGLPRRESGQLECIELRIKFEKEQVEEYSIAALRWH